MTQTHKSNWNKNEKENSYCDQAFNYSKFVAVNFFFNKYERDIIKFAILVHIVLISNKKTHRFQDN